jgi:hypothetical protein
MLFSRRGVFQATDSRGSDCQEAARVQSAGVAQEEQPAQRSVGHPALCPGSRRDSATELQDDSRQAPSRSRTKGGDVEDTFEGIELDNDLAASKKLVFGAAKAAANTASDDDSEGE